MVSIRDDDPQPMEPVLDYATPPQPAALPGARFSLALLLTINLLNYIDRQVLSAVEPNIRAEFHINKTQSGYLATAFILSYMVMAPVFGWLADRTSRWVLVGFSVLLWSAATAAGGLAAGFVMLLITRMFVGVGEAGYGPAAPTIISDLFPVARRGSVLAWFYVAIPVGSALGYVVGGAVGGWLGWRWAFYIVTIPGVLLGIWSFFLKDPPRGAADVGHAIHGLPRLSDYSHLLKIRSYVINTLAMAAMTFAIGGMSYWMPDYLAQHRGLGDSAKIKFGAITVVAGLAATILGGLAGDKLRNRFSGSYFLVSGIGILIAAPFVMAMLYMPFPAAWVMLFGAIFFLFFNTGPSNTALANVVSPSVRASAFAVNIFMIHALGDAPAPPILGHIADHYGWNAAFSLVAACMVIAGILWLIGMPHLKPDTDAVLLAEAASGGFPVVMPLPPVG
jgi:MFS family permease